MALVAPAVAKAAIDNFYQTVLARDATSAEVAGIEAALIGGQSLTSQFAFLRTNILVPTYEDPTIDAFYEATFGRDATRQELDTIEAALLQGQSLAVIENKLTPAMAREIEDAYHQDLGRGLGWSELSAQEAAIDAGASIDAVRASIADSQESAAHIQSIFQQDFGRAASASEIAGWQAAEASSSDAGGVFTVGSNGGVLATIDARTIVVEAATYVTLNGGLTPTLTGSNGQVVAFRNATEFAAYALASAFDSGEATSNLLQTYNLTITWLSQIGQTDIQAASNLQALANADVANGNAMQGYIENIGAQLAMKIQETPPGSRQGLATSVMIGQWRADITVNGDENDPRALAGFAYTLTDTDPARTALVAAAQQQVDFATGRDAQNTFLSMLDNEQARIDVALAALPPDQRYDANNRPLDKMLNVAQRFVDAGYAAAAQGNWNLVQTLETAADVSLQIAAMPAESRVKLTERFMHKDVKHDITVDPNAADPFASFSDHSKGEDVIGAIVEAVVGVVINVLAFVNPELIPLAVTWDAAQAGQSFANGNILGGFLNIASAVGLELSGFSQPAVNVSGSFASQAQSVANFLGFTGIPAVAATGAPAVTAAQQLGQTILSGTALVGGSVGIAQSASRGDALGIAAGALQVVAAVAGGLVSTNQVGGDLAKVFNNVRIYGGLASLGASAADAFANGNLAGGLASSLNALTGVIAQGVQDGAGGSVSDHEYGHSASIDLSASGSSLFVPETLPSIDGPAGILSRYPGSYQTAAIIPVGSAEDSGLPPTSNPPLVANNPYVRLSGESDDQYLNRLTDQSNDLNRLLLTSPDEARAAIRQMNMAMRDDLTVRRDFYANAQHLTADAYLHPQNYGQPYSEQTIGSGAYPVGSATQDRLSNFIATNDNPNLKMGSNGIIYDFSRTLSQVTDTTSVSGGLAILYSHNLQLVENLGSQIQQYGWKAVPQDVFWMAVIGGIGGPGGFLPSTAALQEAIQVARFTGGTVKGIVGRQAMANPDPSLGPNQVRLYVDFADEFGAVTRYSVNYDPDNGHFGIIKPSSDQ